MNGLLQVLLLLCVSWLWFKIPFLKTLPGDSELSTGLLFKDRYYEASVGVLAQLFAHLVCCGSDDCGRGNAVLLRNRSYGFHIFNFFDVGDSAPVISNFVRHGRVCLFLG
jgi:hypothetical protein